MSRRRTARDCQWCGIQFRVQYPTATTLYCGRSHKTAAEKRRKQLRARPEMPCPMPGLPAESIRGLALKEARRCGGKAWACQCGSFHVLDQDSYLLEKWAHTLASLDEVLDVEAGLQEIIREEAW